MATEEAHKHFLSGKTIVVAGAGIAGLSFVIALVRFWDEAIHGPRPNLRIFERDSEGNAIGRQGYSLSLRTDNGIDGMRALQKLGVLDEMINVSITGLEHKGSFSIWDENWKPVMKIGAKLPEGLPVGALRIARNMLRKVLVKAAFQQPKNDLNIEWGRWCVGMVGQDQGRLAVEINDGQVVECDLLIAADGANSKLRSHLFPEDKLQFAGVSAITATSRWNTSPPQPIDQDWGIVLSGSGTALFASPVDQHSAVWSLSWRETQPRQPIKFSEARSDIDALLAEAKVKGSWLPPLWDELLEHTDTSTLWLMNAMDKPPFQHKSTALRKVIFIGDANHAVSPFAGAGANLALMDGLDLATSLLGSARFEEAIKSHDAKAVPRAKKVLSMSHFAISISHAQGFMTRLYIVILKLLYWVFMKKYVEMRE